MKDLKAELPFLDAIILNLKLISDINYNCLETVF